MNKVRIVSGLILLFCLVGCAPAPKLSPEERADIQTHIFSAPYNKVFRAVIEEFHNAGYVIREADLAVGLIDTHYRILTPKGSPIERGVADVIHGKRKARVNAIVTEVGPRTTRVRIVFTMKVQTSFGNWMERPLPEKGMRQFYVEVFQSIEDEVASNPKRM